MTLIARRVSGPRRSFAGFGEISTDVLTVQCGLWQLGFDPGRFDGLWGPVTLGAYDRWYRWWFSREVAAGRIPSDDDPALLTSAPRANRGGAVTMPDVFREIPAAAARGRCALEPRGTHRAPPVPEPQPIEPPAVVVGPRGVPEPPPTPPERAPVQQASMLGGQGGTLLLGLLAVGVIGAAIYYARQTDDFDTELYTLAPPPPLRRR